LNLRHLNPKLRLLFSLADFTIHLKHNFTSPSSPYSFTSGQKKDRKLKFESVQNFGLLGEKTMKKLNVMMALAALTTLASVNAEDAVCGAKKQEATASKVSAEEQAFAGKLNEQNRKAFEQFTAAQKKAAMDSTVAAANKAAMQPNDAVQKVLKEQNVTAAEKAEVKAAAPAPSKAK
jgi:hypothetical protein